MEDEKFMQVNC